MRKNAERRKQRSDLGSEEKRKNLGIILQLERPKIWNR